MKILVETKLDWLVGFGSPVDLQLLNFRIRQTYLLSHTNVGASRPPLFPTPTPTSAKEQQRSLKRKSGEPRWAHSVIILHCKGGGAKEKFPSSWELRVGKWCFHLAKLKIVQLPTSFCKALYCNLCQGDQFWHQFLYFCNSCGCVVQWFSAASSL